jgi:3-phenylpropionate/trans-cinnamate dioxygenase ferredoxin reductase component
MPCFVVLGAGQAGGWAAKTLRDQNFTGRVVIVGDEKHPPYERPPLSKGVLLGTIPPADTYLWSPDKFAEAAIELRPGYRATAIQRESKRVLLSNGEALPYDRLLIATGSRVRRLSTEGAELQRIHYMRSIEDAVAIKQSLSAGSRLLIVGGGWIGLEIAAAARQKNVDVTLVEASNQLCSRALPSNIADHLFRFHKRRGVEILLNTSVVAFHGDEHFKSAELSNGNQIAADSAVIGVGVVPNAEIASEAGLDVNNGIVVDYFCRTSDASIFAAGDVANQPDSTGGRLRLESWANAQNQAIAAAKTMMGNDTRYSDIPYFWSDQYEINLQILGSFTNFDEICIRGDPNGSFTTLYLCGQKLVATVGLNRPQDIAAARRIMQKEIPVNSHDLAVVNNLADVLRVARVGAAN